MIKVLLIMLRHGINPFCEIDDVIISKMRYRLNEKEKQLVINNCNSKAAKDLFTKYLYWGKFDVYFKINSNTIIDTWILFIDSCNVKRKYKQKTNLSV